MFKMSPPAQKHLRQDRSFYPILRVFSGAHLQKTLILQGL